MNASDLMAEIGKSIPANTDKLRIIQELVPGKQITLAHIIANPDDVFEAKTQADFELVMNEPAIEFKKTTVGYAEFTMYYFKSETYENYVFQVDGRKYFINFIHGSGHRDALTEFAASVMDSIVITNDYHWHPVPAE